MRMLWLIDRPLSSDAIEAALAASDCSGLIVSALDAETQIRGRELALPLVVAVSLPASDGLDLTAKLLSLGPDVLREAASAYDPRYRARGCVIEVPDASPQTMTLLWEMGEAFGAWLGVAAREWSFWATCEEDSARAALEAANLRTAHPGPSECYAGQVGRICDLDLAADAVGALPSRLEVVTYAMRVGG